MTAAALAAPTSRDGAGLMGVARCIARDELTRLTLWNAHVYAHSKAPADARTTRVLSIGCLDRWVNMGEFADEPRRA